MSIPKKTLLVIYHNIKCNVISSDGESPRLIIKGENTLIDSLFENIFSLSKNTNIFHCNCFNEEIPIGLIGGRGGCGYVRWSLNRVPLEIHVKYFGK
jgi:hypothetical protein